MEVMRAELAKAREALATPRMTDIIEPSPISSMRT